MASKSDLRERRFKKPNFITPGGSRLSDLDDEELTETLRSTVAAAARRKKGDSSPEHRRQQQQPASRKAKKSSSTEERGRIGILFKLTVCQHFLLLFGMLALGLVGLLVLLPNPIEPVTYRLEPPPSPAGPLAVNKRLTAARKFLIGELRGPESFAFAGGYLYTGTLDGRIVRVGLKTEQPELWVRFGPANCSHGKNVSPLVCGRPLGMRIDPRNRSRLLVADAYLGLMEVSLETRAFRPLVDRSHPVGVTFFDDLDVTPDGLAFVSEASTRFPLHHLMHQVLEASSNGRLLQVNLTSGHAAPVLEGLNFPNGVQLHPDGQSVLLAETMAFRIVRYYFAGPLAGQKLPFAANLPLAPDNIRLSSDARHLWVAGSVTRLSGLRNIVDLMSERTWLRLVAAKLIPSPLLHRLAAGHYGLILKLDASDGRLVESLHDAEGGRITHSSEVHEHEGRLYIGTYYASYLATLQL